MSGNQGQSGVTFAGRSRRRRSHAHCAAYLDGRAAVLGRESDSTEGMCVMPLTKAAQRAWAPETLRYANDFTLPVQANDSPFPGGSQTADLHLELTVGGYVQPGSATDSTKGEEYYVVADLAGSTFTPGTMICDDAANRGFYTHSIDVKMTFDAVVPATGAPSGALTLATSHTSPYVMETSTPVTSLASGSSSSGSSTSASFGFFGDTLTGTVGVGTSESDSRSYQDFEVSSRPSHAPSAETAEQFLALRVSDLGGYHIPADLVDNKHNLTTLPPRATSAMPIVSAASFLHVGAAKSPPPAAVLAGRVEATLVGMFWLDGATFGKLAKVGSYAVFLGMLAAGSDKSKTTSFDPHRPFHAQYLLPSGCYVAVPRVVGANFACDVDFAAGKVSLR